MESIRRQFSLDWLPGSEDTEQKESSRATKSSLDEARRFVYGSAIGNFLRKAPNNEMALHDLARMVKHDIGEFKFEDLWQVITLLADRGVIRIENFNAPEQNYTIRLTGQP